MGDTRKMEEMSELLREDRQSTAEEIERGIHIAESLPDVDFRSWYLSRFARKLTPINWKRAVEIAQAADGFYDRFDALLVIAAKLVEIGVRGEATSILKEVVRASEQEDPEVWPWQRADVLNRCAKIFRQLALHAEAMSTWEKAVRIAKKGQASDTDTLTVLTEIAKELTLAGHVEYARQVADSIQSDRKRRHAHKQIDELEQAG